MFWSKLCNLYDWVLVNKNDQMLSLNVNLEQAGVLIDPSHNWIKGEQLMIFLDAN